MLLRDISGGKISGTGTLTSETGVVGGVLITTDGTNAVTVVLRKNDAAGDIVFELTTKQPIFCAAPFHADDKVYYSVTGTGGGAQIYEWVN